MEYGILRIVVMDGELSCIQFVDTNYDSRGLGHRKPAE